MTMEIEFTQLEPAVGEEINKDRIIDFLTNNESICFKSQQRGEDDLNKQEKTVIASELYDKNKLNFLLRFGNYLQRSHIEYFKQFDAECAEMKIVIRDLLGTISSERQIRNRRYQALTKMIKEDSYFSEIEMMKRNPLLYDQLVNQFMTQQEREERDRININEQSTLVKVLMEGIERDCAKVKKQQQEEYEDDVMEEDDDSDLEEDKSPKRTANWGEFLDEPRASTSTKAKTTYIAAEEQKLLKEEFITSMYENFLSGHDDDFDYATVDNNTTYDNSDMNEYDAEDKYFDSEEPETVCIAEKEESEDELDIFMSGLNQHPGVSQLSKDIEKL